MGYSEQPSLRHCWFFLGVVFILATILMILFPEHTAMPQSLSDSEQKSSSLNATSWRWEQLSTMFQAELTALQEDLQAALKEAQGSKTSLDRLTNLYAMSSRRVTVLEDYNSQIAERMQDRDEELARYYELTSKLEKTILQKETRILKLVIAIIALSLVIVGLVVVLILVIKGKVSIPGIFGFVKSFLGG